MAEGSTSGGSGPGPSKVKTVAPSGPTQGGQKDNKNVYQFKITLKYTKPPIWRRIQVPEDYNFRQFHKAIQCAMGWRSATDDYHLHKFGMPNGTTIGIKFPAGFSGLDFGIQEKTALIKNYFNLEYSKKARYEYDFGDGWDHDILLENILPAAVGKSYPTCITGKRACPPEDVGGVGGFYEFLEVLKDPTHPEHDERKDWAECQGFDVNSDPANFNPDGVDFSEMNRLFGLKLSDSDSD